MAKAYSLHIALNSVDPKVYEGNAGFLSVCENDAMRYAQIALEMDYHYIKLLLGKNATKSTFIALMKHFGKTLRSEDYLLLTFSGHGGQKKDINLDEENGKDETWCFYDGEILDDELYALWQHFKYRTRIFVISDSCHSGSILKSLFPIKPNPNAFLLGKNEVVKSATFNKTPQKVKASIHLMAAAKEDQKTYQDKRNSRFTRRLLEVWDGGKFSGNHTQFFNAICRRIDKQNPPVQNFLGTPNSAFSLQKPFAFK
jgi:hypothetical protein